MKRIKDAVIITVVVGAVSLVCVPACASDYKGDENSPSIFQRLGDLITGTYKVDGKPLNKIGVFNVLADQAKSVGPNTEKIESSWNPTEPPAAGDKK